MYFKQTQIGRNRKKNWSEKCNYYFKGKFNRITIAYISLKKGKNAEIDME